MSNRDGNAYLEHLDYVGFAQALADAEQVLIDLQRLAQGHTVIATDEFEFLARRARQLVRGCIDLEAEL